MVLSEAYPHHHIPEYPELHSELLTEDPLSLIVPSTSTITSIEEAARTDPGSSKWSHEHLPQAGHSTSAAPQDSSRSSATAPTT